MSSVDVIVPCYRYGHYLRNCVRSVLTQEGCDVRVLIIDDASPDSTAEVGQALAREDHRVEFRRHETNKGHIATYNEGLDWASSDYLLLLSADDYLLPGSLARACTVFDADLRVGLVFGACMELSPDGETEEVVPVKFRTSDNGSRRFTGHEFIELSGANNIVPTPTAVIRTALQKRAGNYLASLPHTADMEMWFRLASYGDVVVARSPQAVYRLHGKNMSLGYTVKSRLPDLQQRKAALEHFFASSRDRLSRPDDLRQQMQIDLARQAVHAASKAFNARDMDADRGLTSFAIGLDPMVRRSWPWLKLCFKRLLGHRGWNALQLAFAGLRGWSADTRGRSN